MYVYRATTDGGRPFMTLADAPDVLTVAECASLARTGPKPIYKAIAAGELYGRRIGGGLRIPKRAFVAWLEGAQLDGAVSGSQPATRSAPATRVAVEG